jgi:hypothetical protein
MDFRSVPLEVTNDLYASINVVESLIKYFSQRNCKKVFIGIAFG